VETSYRVEPGDTLWAIAAERYAGDPREAVWKIKNRNGLATSALTPGTVLVLPR
jgi:nucleoid-associated protein YgaU